MKIAELNNKQQYAVNIGHKENALILAGAGSGKTRVLTYRVVHLINNCDRTLHNILALTFTNKAAREMSLKISELLKTPINRSSWIGTFHGIAHKILRIHADKIGLKNNFQILDSQDQLAIIKKIAKEQNIDVEKFPISQILHFINSNKNNGLSANDIDFNYNFFAEKATKIFSAYEKYCQQEHLLDFAEILLSCYRLLNENKKIINAYQTQFNNILVDEFQDTNAMQYKLIKLFKNNDNAIFCVGDDDQSIYGWRGAKIENIKKLSTDFAPLKIIKLEQNYRSTANILNASNAVITNNNNRIGKSLWTDGNAGELIDFYHAKNEKQEASFVVKTIQQLIINGERVNECAILYRSNVLSRMFEESLIKYKINYNIHGGLRFFDRKEIKDAICYLRLISDNNDSIAFNRIINFPTRGIGNKTINIIENFANENATSLFIASKKIITQIPVRAANALNNFINLIDEIDKSLPLSELLEEIVNKSLLLQHYTNNKNDKSLSKIDNLKELIGAAKEFNNDDEFLNDIDAFIAMSSLENDNKNNDNAVQLMTIHAAKGLEFNNVFVVGLEDDIFPSSQSKEKNNLLDEERRLCYVAMTRAKQKLTLSCAKTRFLYGRVFYSRISRFINEIPKKFINNINSINNYIITENNNTKNNEFNIGEQVKHHKFGIGIVTNFMPNIENARIEINFKKFGTKQLIVNYANLIKI